MITLPKRCCRRWRTGAITHPMPRAAPISSACPEPGRPGADDFLQRDDVGVDVAQHFGDACRRDAAVHTARAMDVVGGDAEIDVPAATAARGLGR